MNGIEKERGITLVMKGYSGSTTNVLARFELLKLGLEYRNGNDSREIGKRIRSDFCISEM